jgi:hypothetical protein
VVEVVVVLVVVLVVVWTLVLVCHEDGLVDDPVDEFCW